MFSVIGASTTTVSEHGVDLYSQARSTIATAVFADTATRKLAPCQSRRRSTTLASAVHQQFGLRAWRRPLEHRGAALQGARHPSSDSAIPGHPAVCDGGDAAVAELSLSRRAGRSRRKPSRWLRYTGYEMASRLSFLLRNTFPDAELFAAAASGELVTKTDPDASQSACSPMRAHARDDHAALLRVPRSSLLLDVLFPATMDPNGTIGASMQSEVIDIVNRIALEQPADMRTLFTTPTTFGQPRSRASTASRRPPATRSASPAARRRSARRHPHDRRADDAQQPTEPNLADHPRALRSSALALRHRSASARRAFRRSAKTTMRSRRRPSARSSKRTAPTRRAQRATRSMDPIGLGMEDFDQYGRYRTIYDTGQRSTTAATSTARRSTARASSAICLSKDPRMIELPRQAVLPLRVRRGSRPTPKSIVLAELDDAFAEDGYQLKPLLLELVGSDGFRLPQTGGTMISRRCGSQGVLGGSAFCLGLAAARADAEQQRHRARGGRGAAQALRAVLLGQRAALELAAPGHDRRGHAGITHDLTDSLTDLYTPTTDGKAGRSPTRSKPLAAHKANINVVTGLEPKTDDSDHPRGPVRRPHARHLRRAHAPTRFEPEGFDHDPHIFAVSRATLDQYIAKHPQFYTDGAPQFRSLELGMSEATLHNFGAWTRGLAQRAQLAQPRPFEIRRSFSTRSSQSSPTLTEITRRRAFSTWSPRTRDCSEASARATSSASTST